MQSHSDEFRYWTPWKGPVLIPNPSNTKQAYGKKTKWFEIFSNHPSHIQVIVVDCNFPYKYLGTPCLSLYLHIYHLSISIYIYLYLSISIFICSSICTPSKIIHLPPPLFSVKSLKSLKSKDIKERSLVLWWKQWQYRNRSNTSRKSYCKQPGLVDKILHQLIVWVNDSVLITSLCVKCCPSKAFRNIIPRWCQ